MQAELTASYIGVDPALIHIFGSFKIYERRFPLIVQGTVNQYEIGAVVAENKRFEVGLCTQLGDAERNCLVVVAQNGQNSVVDLWAFILKELAQHAERLEEEYALVKTDPKNFLNYHLGFPILIETFKSKKDRQMMTLAFQHSEPSAMVPIAKMVKKDKLRVDLKTSVWMMGKLLKILGFAHNQGISIGKINSGKILLDPDQHYVNIFDWSHAQFSDSLTEEVMQQEISDAAKVIIEALGGDVNNHTIPNNEGEEGKRYCAHLWTLVDGLFCNANVAHKHFYEFVEQLWERKFYPFTTFARTGDCDGTRNFF